MVTRTRQGSLAADLGARRLAAGENGRLASQAAADAHRLAREKTSQEPQKLQSSRSGPRIKFGKISKATRISVGVPAIELGKGSAKERTDAQPMRAATVKQAAQVSHVVFGREQESQRLAEILHAFADASAPPSRQGENVRASPVANVYVCGLPGTGKSLTVSRVVSALSDRIDVISVNCAEFRDNANALLPTVLEQLRRKSGNKDACVLGMDSRTACEQLVATVSRSGSGARRVLLVFDEMDFLLSRDQSLLYSVFELPKRSAGRIGIVGIANALDMPTRAVPWLRASASMPETVLFTSYTADALAHILQAHVAEHPDADAIKPALQLCCKRVAATTGDVRIARQVLLSALYCDHGAGADSLPSHKVANDAGCEASESAPRRDAGYYLGRVCALLQAKGGSGASIAVMQGLPLHQQLTLACAVRLVFSLAQHGQRRLTLGTLYDEMSRQARVLNVQHVSMSQFVDLCQTSLEHHNLLAISGSKDLRKRFVALRVPVPDVMDAIGQVRLFSTIFSSCKQRLTPLPADA
ncbi:Cell division control protein 6-like B [Porphyridium purpureum]|uniref:Cell division control protein 6-like B n=1 Tax=Porphyridium purpureum TaxID=35688 RepID=A0A5J4Z438_PORPP|nr:Cell division control protein 6-like B [Porphyridium purpureum]|eukprot:POR7749..scf295_1